MSELEASIDIINGASQKVQNSITSLSQSSGDEFAAKMRAVENDFGNLQDSVDILSQSMMVYSSADKARANDFLQQTKAKMDFYKKQIEQAKKNSLLSTTAGLRLDGTSAAQRQSLQNQSDLLDKNSGLIDECNNVLDETITRGNATLEELERQRSTIGNLGDHVDELNTTIDDSDSILKRMICRDRKKSIFMGVIVVVMLAAIITFLVLLFKK